MAAQFPPPDRTLADPSLSASFAFFGRPLSEFGSNVADPGRIGDTPVASEPA